METYEVLLTKKQAAKYGLILGMIGHTKIQSLEAEIEDNRMTVDLKIKNCRTGETQCKTILRETEVYDLFEGYNCHRDIKQTWVESYVVQEVERHLYFIANIIKHYNVLYVEQLITKGLENYGLEGFASYFFEMWEASTLLLQLNSQK